MIKILVLERDRRMNQLYLDVLGMKYEVKFAVDIDVMKNHIYLHADAGGLEYYDVILIDPYFSHYPLYSYEETDQGLQTGWFIYRDFMQNLTSTVIIWTYPVEQYQYDEHNYPERSWGSNVAGVFMKDFSPSYLPELIEKYARRPTKS